MKELGIENNQGIESTHKLVIAKIQAYIGSSLMSSFRDLKDLIATFLVIWYQDGKL